ncbi:MAG TPA: MFS transporter [Candidatus Limnocylindrales bacterium]
MNSTQRWTLVAAILGSAIVFLDGTIVNVALPIIGRQLPATFLSQLEAQTYVVSGYIATLAALLVLAGALADFYGRRRVFLIGLAGFGMTSILCGIAPTMEILVITRVLQGAAGALLVPGSLSIITATFDGPARGRAFGIWAAATSATTTLGPPIGGILVEAVSWRSAFLINGPLVLIALYATVRYMRESRDEDASPHFDWLGAFAAVLGIGGLAFGAIRGQDRQWQDPIAFVALAVGAVATLAFVVLMARRPYPLIPLSLFRSRGFATINLSTLLIYGALYTTFTFQALFLQGVLGYSPLGSAITGLPVGILLTVLSTRAGSLAGRIGARPFLTIGPLLMAVGLAWFGRIPASSAPWAADMDTPASLIPPVDVFVDVLPAILLFGIGISLVVAPLTSTLMSSVPVRNAGIASAINNAISRVGYPLLAAVIFIVVSGSFYARLAALVPGVDPASPELRTQVQPLNPPADDAPPEIRTAATVASTDAFHLAALVGAGLLIMGAAVNWVGLGGRPEAEAERPGAAEPAVPAG